MKKTAAVLFDYYKGWLSKYPFVSNEDPLDQKDSDAYMMFMDAVGKNQQTIGDNLLMKVNQFGSITEPSKPQ